MSLLQAFLDSMGLADPRASAPVATPLTAEEAHRQRHKIADHIARYERAIACTTDPALLAEYRAELAKWQLAAEEIR